MKTFFKWLRRIALLYGAVGLIVTIAFYFFQERLLFHPKALPAEHQFRFRTPFKETFIKYDEDNNYNIVQFHPADTAVKGVVLYFHGNEKNIERYAPYAELFVQQGWEVWMIDYPGFGKSTGELSESHLYEMALQFYKLARTRFDPNEIIIYGKSLGTGIATYLASVRDCQRLILETPYYSLKSLVNTYSFIAPVGVVSRFNLPTYQFIQQVDAPITIFHGTKDEVIPYKNAEKLKKFLKPIDEFITLQNGKHNDLTDLDEMSDRLKALLTTPL